MDLIPILNSDFVKQAGAAGVSVLVLGGLLVLFVWKVLPKLNQTWAEQIAAERDTNAKRADADRQLFRDIHDESVRTATARHEEARGWHGEILTRLDKNHSEVMDGIGSIYSSRNDGTDSKKRD